MNPHNCIIKHDPPNSYGDCVRACIATIINRDDVPHVFDDSNAEAGWSALRCYLAKVGMSLALLQVDDPWEFMENNNYGVPYMLLCQSSGMDHAVVCLNGKVYHDPAWYKTPITGPHSLGVWIIGIVGVLT